MDGGGIKQQKKMVLHDFRRPEQAIWHPLVVSPQDSGTQQVKRKAIRMNSVSCWPKMFYKRSAVIGPYSLISKSCFVFPRNIH